jgi:sphingomyelin phosphodiesterase
MNLNIPLLLVFLPLMTWAASNNTIGTSTFTVSGGFPTSLFEHYYNSPTATSAQVQPVISDPVTHKTYPLSLTDPNSLPFNDASDPHPLPPKASHSRLYNEAYNQVLSIASSPNFDSKCARCQAALEPAKFLALAAPELGPNLTVALCEHFNFSATCQRTYGDLAFGSVITQVISNADAGGMDGQYLCSNFLRLCPTPPTSPLNLTGWFAKPKPNPLPPLKQPSGKRLKVLHISDFHLDASMATG